MKTAIFDLETDNLLDKVTKVHCIVIEDFETGVRTRYTSTRGNLVEGIKVLESVHTLVGCNIMDYDLRVLKKLYPWFNSKAKVIRDTLVCTRVIWADIRDTDFSLFKKGKLPAKLIGRHSLESWGYRLGLHKGEFGKTADWSVITDEMVDYCDLDVQVTSKLYHLILRKEVPESVLQMEHDIHAICLKQTEFGFPFDVKKANILLGKLLSRKAELHQEIFNTLGPSWIVNLGEKCSKTTRKYKDPLRGDESAGCFWTKIKFVEFNPTSRSHLAKRLQEVCGWKPTEFGDDGIPNLDEEVLSSLKYPVAKQISEYMTIQKRLGMLAEGKQAWLSLEVDGKIHGSVNTHGAVTTRCTHSHPNLAQIPSNDSAYGKECRELFRAPSGWKMFGSDVAGLELRMLAHYMAKWDGGKYGEIILNGDIHTANQEAAGLPTRGSAKSFIYCWLYGGGDEKIGSLVNGNKARGKQLKEQFLKNTPALKSLREAVSATARDKGRLKAIDGRHIPVRHQHAALNTLLQSAGSIVCKMWVIRMHEIMKEKGFTHGVEYKQLAFIHDEQEWGFDPNKMTGEMLGEISSRAIKEIGIELGIRIPLATDWKEGVNFSECH